MRAYDHRHYKTFTHGESILRQYIGIKNKKGEEIYEGDIVRRDRRRFLVQWASFGTGYMPFINQITCQHGDPDVEIIGNIYENPDLLEAA